MELGSTYSVPVIVEALYIGVFANNGAHNTVGVDSPVDSPASEVRRVVSVHQAEIIVGPGLQPAFAVLVFEVTQVPPGSKLLLAEVHKLHVS
jgi:hypothetical protein